jgi:hypothetical protein
MKARRPSGSDTNLSSRGLDGSAIEDVLKNTQEALAAAIISTEKEAAARARTESELDSIIDELIDAKVRFAHVASELDVERVRTLKLRNRLQLYAETLTSMEVRLRTGSSSSAKGGGDRDSSLPFKRDDGRSPDHQRIS